MSTSSSTRAHQRCRDNSPPDPSLNPPSSDAGQRNSRREENRWGVGTRLEIIDLVMGGLLVLDQRVLARERRTAHRALVRFPGSPVGFFHPLVMRLVVFPEVFLGAKIRSADLARGHAFARHAIDVFFSFFFAHVDGIPWFSD